eukprot:SAG11_NODE_1013_length_6187_cov_15.834593_2_plen_76_part_00
MLKLFLYNADENKDENIACTRPNGIADHKQEADAEAARPSGDKAGGFVVYAQTVELVEMLGKSAGSVLGDGADEW